jgi:ferric-dicitrate binding protein FerR (iron transport regulator)
MDREFDHMDDLIGKVLAGEATAEEQLQIAQWARENEVNRKYYEHLQTIFDKSASANVQIQFDTDAAWRAVQQRLRKAQIQDPGFKIQDPSYWSVLKIAAGIVFLLGAGFFAYQLMETPAQTFAVVSDKVTVQDTLPDGSTAFLNKKSELSFEYDAKENTRRVKLKGEAYFAVRHEADKPFVIETDEVLVRDIGTEFNLKAYPDQDTIEIVVTSGQVQFYTVKNSGLNLKAGEKGIYSKRSKEFYRIEKIDTNTLAYKTKVFSFNNTDLGAVVNLLNDVYDSKIKLVNKDLHNCRLTANFKEDNPDTIVEVIAETMGLTITRQGDEILLDGKGCTN